MKNLFDAEHRTKTLRKPKVPFPIAPPQGQGSESYQARLWLADFLSQMPFPDFQKSEK
jgi:hypothetical protein